MKLAAEGKNNKERKIGWKKRIIKKMFEYIQNIQIFFKKAKYLKRFFSLSQSISHITIQKNIIFSIIYYFY